MVKATPKAPPNFAATMLFVTIELLNFMDGTNILRRSKVAAPWSSSD
jgi:hypothetical protein